MTREHTGPLAALAGLLMCDVGLFLTFSLGTALIVTGAALGIMGSLYALGSSKGRR